MADVIADAALILSSDCKALYESKAKLIDADRFKQD